MTRLATAVRDYWRGVSSLITLEPTVLQEAIDALEIYEKKLLDSHRKDSREFMMHKVFNRHNDICDGNTVVEFCDAIITTRSAISELDISLSTLLDCNKNGIYKIEDLTSESIKKLRPDSMREVDEALRKYAEE